MGKILTFEDFDFVPDPDQCRMIYESGYRGVLPSAHESMRIALASDSDFYSAFPEARDIGKGKMAAPYVLALAQEPQFGRMENQGTGDCVSHGERNAGSIDWYCDLFFGETKLPSEGQEIKTRAGVYKITKVVPRLCTEPQYGYRGHGGEGASCSRLLNYVVSNGPGGFLVRCQIEGPNGQVLDLSKYNWKVGHNWGPSGTPQWVNEICAVNKSLRTFPCKSLDMARDAIYLGFGVFRCSWMGFSNQRNEDGFAVMNTRWSHSESWIGFDDTPYCVKRYGSGAPLEQNSWGDWNSGPKRYNQPDGSYFMYPKDARQMIEDGEIYIIASVQGYNRELVMDRSVKLAQEYRQAA